MKATEISFKHRWLGSLLKIKKLCHLWGALTGTAAPLHQSTSRGTLGIWSELLLGPIVWRFSKHTPLDWKENPGQTQNLVMAWDHPERARERCFGDEWLGLHTGLHFSYCFNNMILGNLVIAIILVNSTIKMAVTIYIATESINLWCLAFWAMSFSGVSICWCETPSTWLNTTFVLQKQVQNTRA